MIKVKWSEKEGILLLDLFYKLIGKAISPDLPEVIELSARLNRLADKEKIIKDEKFRNPVGISMKLQNIRYVITDGKEGLSCASQLDYQVCKKYENRLEKLFEDAKKIIDGIT